MFGIFIFIPLIVIIYFGLQFIFRTESRVEASIKKNGSSKGLEVLFIRDVTRFDGENPFSKLDIRFSLVSTTFLGFNGEDIYTKIVTIQNEKGEEVVYWVQVETVFFRPSEILWLKMNVIGSRD